MYTYVKRMCQASPGCALAYPTCDKSSEVVFNFPIEAPFLVMFLKATLLVNTRVMRGMNATVLAAEKCAVLHVWNLSLVHRPLLLHQLS
jgi:hypothetical protein